MPTGGRLAAGILMMLAMVGAMVIYLDEAGFDPLGWQMPLIAAAVIGFWSGWSQLGPKLGREFISSGAFAIGAGLTALVFFALIYGFRSAYITHIGVQFDAAIDVISHILTAGMDVLKAVAASPRTMAAFGIGCLIAGIISEYCNRIWR